MSSYASTPLSRNQASRGAVLGLACVAAGVAFALYTQAVLIAAGAAVALLIMHWLVRARLPLSQALMSISLAGFIVFNYGFENLIVGRIAGIPLLVGEFVMFGGLLLAIRSHGAGHLQRLRQDPVVLCLIFLLIFAVLHLIVDVPRYGLYAFRDASMYFEAVFLVAGYFWAAEENGVRRFIQCLLLIFALNALYSFTLPWGERLQGMSPKSGVFQPVSVLGQYQHCAMYLVAGALFYVWLTDYTKGWTRRILLAMAAIQICGLAVLQSRAMYVGTAAVLALLFVLRETGKLRRSFAAIGGGVAVMVGLLLVVSLCGITIQGRVGEINGDFLRQYALSVLAIDNSNSRLAKDDDRLDWFRQVWSGTATDPVTLFVGQGFGLPLIDFEAEDGMPVRQPHNAALGVFGRLGLAGLCIWLIFQLLLIKRFLRALRAAQGPLAHDLILWLLTFYVLAFILSMTQPAMEFSHYAVPVYFVVGFALRVMHITLDSAQAQTGKLASSRYVEQHSSQCCALL